MQNIYAKQMTFAICFAQSRSGSHEGRVREGLHNRSIARNQISRLAETGCEIFFEEKTSGAAKKRPQLEKLLGQLRKDDVVVITRLDRLSRSTAELLRIAEVLKEKKRGNTIP